MTVQVAPTTKRIDWRANTFRVAAFFIGLFYLAISAPYMLWPWNIMPLPLEGVLDADPWRWHAAVWVSFGTILSCVPLFLLLKRPREKPLLMQFWLVGQFAAAVIYLVFDWPEFTPDQLIVVGLILITYPSPRALLKFKPQAPFSRLGLAMTAVVALAMVPFFVSSIRLHLGDVGSQLQETGQYMHGTYVAMLLPLAGFLAATRRSGWKALAIVTSITMVYLGLSAITLPDHVGSWGTIGGIAAILGGGAFLASTRGAE